MRIRAIKGSGEESSNHVSMPTSEPSKPSKRSQQSEQAEQVKKPSCYSASKLANQPTNQPNNRPTDQATNQPTNQPAGQRTTELIVKEGRKEGRGTKSCFKFAQNRICISSDSQISQIVYLSLQLQNHMGFRFWSSWGVVEQISKSHW